MPLPPCPSTWQAAWTLRKTAWPFARPSGARALRALCTSRVRAADRRRRRRRCPPPLVPAAAFLMGASSPQCGMIALGLTTASQARPSVSAHHARAKQKCAKSLLSRRAPPPLMPFRCLSPLEHRLLQVHPLQVDYRLGALLQPGRLHQGVGRQLPRPRDYGSEQACQRDSGQCVYGAAHVRLVDVEPRRQGEH